MVQADPLEEGFLPVQVESVRPEFRRPDAERRLVDGFGAVGSLDDRPRNIEFRLDRCPEDNILHIKRLRNDQAVRDPLVAPGLGQHAFNPLPFPGHGNDLRNPVQDLGRHQADIGFFPAFQGHLQGDMGRMGAGLLRGHEGAPMRDGNPFLTRQPDIAVNAAARVPAGGILLVFEGHGQAVDALFQERCQIGPERGIAIGPLHHELPVAPDLGARHGPVDIQVERLSQFLRRDGQLLGIGGIPPPRKLAGLAGIGLVELAFHTPVMGQVQHPAGTVLLEGPSLIEKDAVRGLRRGRNSGQPQQAGR